MRPLHQSDLDLIHSDAFAPRVARRSALSVAGEALILGWLLFGLPLAALVMGG